MIKDTTIVSPTDTSQHSLIAQLRSRLTLTVSVLVCCLLLISTISIYLAVNQQRLGDEKLSIHEEISTLTQAMIDQETGLRGYITTNNTAFLQPLTDGRAQYNTALENLRSQISNTDFHTTSSALTRVDAQVNNWVTNFAELQIANIQNGRLALARSDAVNTQGKAIFDIFRSDVAQLEAAADNDLAGLQAQENILNYSALVGSLVLTIVVIIWLWRTFTRFSYAQRTQLALLKETAAAFGTGNLSARVERVTDVDLSDLGHSFNAMANTLQEQQNALKDRDILELVSQLNTTLTSSLDLTAVIHNFLSSVLTLLDVQMGVLYLYDDDKNLLRLFSAHGLHTEDIQTTFELGEGSVGQAALERQPLLFPQQQISPPDFRIKTMLGFTLPASLYHLPLVRGNGLLGVLVVGSLYPMREQARNVLNVMISNLAAVISNVQDYMHIQEQASELAILAREQERSNQALRQRRDELTVLNQALEEANRVRSQFLSTMSHELRTPLTSVIGFSQILLRTSARGASLSERQHDNVERILKNANHLLTLINSVLDLAKIEAGRMDVNASEVNLKELFTALVDETRSLALERNLYLRVDVDDDITTIETDPTKLRQIILNLVSNAIKFTENGGVIISISRRVAASGAAKQLAIAVKDTGIGISVQQQQRIFDAFYQIDNSNTRSYGGTGLGLSIVRELTTLLGGIIEIESQVGEGSTFTLVLPVHVHDRQLPYGRLSTIHGEIPIPRYPPSVSIINDENQQDEESETFLVVAIDDNPDVLQLITAALEQTPYRVVGVQDPTQAIPVIQEMRPHAITLDIMMPHVNGWQILHQLKSNPSTSSIPVILLTILEDRSAGYVLGADEYLVKPIARDALIATLRQLTASSSHRPLIKNGEMPSNPLQENDAAYIGQMRENLKQILLVNNAPHVHDIIERLVSEKGYSLETTDDVQNLMSIIEHASPDVLMILVQLGEQISGAAVDKDKTSLSTTLEPPQDTAEEGKI